MNHVEINRSSYYFAAMEGDDKIANYAKDNLQFCYGSVQYEKFSEEYDRDPLESDLGWRRTKALALAFCGVVKVIHHLAKAILIGLPKAIMGDRDYLKSHGFYIARDLQETYGWLVSLIGKKRGQFHILESQFQKACYDCFFYNGTFDQQKRPTWPGGTLSEIKKFGVSVSVEARNTSLFDYKYKGEEERRSLEHALKFTPSSFPADEAGMTLDQFLDQANDDFLKDLKIEELLLPFKNSKLKFALPFMKGEVPKILLKDLRGDVNQHQLPFFVKRLKDLVSNGAGDLPSKRIEDLGSVESLSVIDLFAISADSIAKHKESLPASAFAFFSDAQIQKLKLAELSQDRAMTLFEFSQSPKKRLALFEDLDVVNAVDKQVLVGQVLRDLSDEQIKRIKLSELPRTSVDFIFPQSEKYADSNRRRLDLVEESELQKMLEKGLLRGINLR